MTGTPAIETSRAAVATTLNQTTSRPRRSSGRKFEDLLTLTPGVSVVQGPDGDAITFAGQRGIFNNISLDGGDYNNGFFGEQVGGQRAAIDITLDAVKEFQVIATGAPAEFGRTAGGVVNVITKSGTNDVQWQPVPLPAARSADQRAVGRHDAREVPSRAVRRHVRRADPAGSRRSSSARSRASPATSSGQTWAGAIGTPCPVAAPTLAANEALINVEPGLPARGAPQLLPARGSGQDEGRPHRASDQDRRDAAQGATSTLNAPNRLALVLQLQSLAQGERDLRRRDLRHLGQRHRRRPGAHQRGQRQLVHDACRQQAERVPLHLSAASRGRAGGGVELWRADTGMGFGPDASASAIRSSCSRTSTSCCGARRSRTTSRWCTGRHTFKMGGEWMHTLNDQVFRGFFTGRYLFDSVTGFLRYASPAAAGRVRAQGRSAARTALRDGAGAVSCRQSPTGGPLLFYLQGAGRTGPATDAAGASKITNDEFSLFIQDQWQVAAEHHAAVRPALGRAVMPETVDPTTTAFAALPRRSGVSVGRHDSRSVEHVAAARRRDVGRDAATDVRCCATQRRRLLRAAEHAEPGRIGDDQRPAAADDLRQHRPHRQFGVPVPVWPGVLTPSRAARRAVSLISRASASSTSRLQEPAHLHVQRRLRTGVRAATGRRMRTSPGPAGRDLTRFLNYNRGIRSCCDPGPGTGNTYVYAGAPLRAAARRGDGDDQPGPLAVQRRSRSACASGSPTAISSKPTTCCRKDKDDDSNERDPFTDRSFNFFDLDLDYGLSDRDIRHKFNLFGYFELPWRVRLNTRVQARGAQPITPSPRSLERRRSRPQHGCARTTSTSASTGGCRAPFRFGGARRLLPTIEMFNTFNNANNINPLTHAGAVQLRRASCGRAWAIRGRCSCR